jgi:hypothetical protein
LLLQVLRTVLLLPLLLSIVELVVGLLGVTVLLVVP